MQAWSTRRHAARVQVKIRTMLQFGFAQKVEAKLVRNAERVKTDIAGHGAVKLRRGFSVGDGGTLGHSELGGNGCPVRREAQAGEGR